MYYEKLKDLGIELKNSRGQQKVVCPKCSPTRKNKRDTCLSVNVNTGDYNCHNSSCTFRGTVRTSINAQINSKEYKKPSQEELRNIQRSEGVIAFFKKRGISEKTINQFSIYSREEWMPQVNAKTNVICFPYIDEKLQITNIKYRDKDKNFKLFKDAKLIMYNLQSLRNKKYAIITEGEIDCMSLYEAGVGGNEPNVDVSTGELGEENWLNKWSLLSVPNGASLGGSAKLEYLENNAELLMGVSEFIIATDNDEAGEALKKELIKRLGAEKCRTIQYPTDLVVPTKEGFMRACKDMNEVLLHFGALHIQNMIINSELIPIEGIYFVDSIKESMLNDFRNGVQLGAPTRFGVMDDYFRWKPGDINLWIGYGNSGKALALDTKIPTPNGFKNMGDLIDGDDVFDEDGNICQVIMAHNIMYNRPCYKVTFSDNTTVVCDEEHLWLTYNEQERASENRFNRKNATRKNYTQVDKRLLPQVRTTKEIYDTLYSRVNSKRPSINHSVNLSKPINLPNAYLLIDPYCLGAWLGDGCKNNARIASNDFEIIEFFNKNGYPAKKQKANFMYGIGGGFQVKLREIGVLNNKHIPKEYLRSSIEQRLELLKGLMDTDGHIDNAGMCEFTTIKENLSNEVYELITSLGMKATISVGDATLNGRFISKKYRILFMPNINVFNLTRKANKFKKGKKSNCRHIKNVEKVDSVPVRCITVNSINSLYLCTESFIPTHNTTLLMQLMIIKSMYDGWKWAVFSPENFPANDFYNDLVEMYVGKWIGHMTEEEYSEACDFLNEHIFYVYPDNEHDIVSIHEKFRYLVLKYGVDGVVIDPFNQLDHLQKNFEREDMYLSRILKDIKRFALSNGVNYNIVAHPKTPKYNEDRSLPVVDMYDVAGGAMWGNKVDQIISYYRPNFHTDKNDPCADIHIQKLKRKRTGGKLGFFSTILNWQTKRYMVEGVVPLDKEYAKQVLALEARQEYTQAQLISPDMQVDDGFGETPLDTSDEVPF